MLLSESINEHARVMHRSRAAITEGMLAFSCQRCGRSFNADEIAVTRRADRDVYRCPTDGVDLVRVGVGEMGHGGGDVEVDQAERVRVRLDTEEVDWMDFLERSDT
jgi:hypothetical protein